MSRSKRFDHMSKYDPPPKVIGHFDMETGVFTPTPPEEIQAEKDAWAERMAHAPMPPGWDEEEELGTPLIDPYDGREDRPKVRSMDGGRGTG